MSGGISGISPGFPGLSQSSGHVTHVLLTRSRLCPRASPGSSLHLHVLSTPPAFVLSQDQTLRERLACQPVPRDRSHCLINGKLSLRVDGDRVHSAAHLGSTGLSTTAQALHARRPQGRTWTRPKLRRARSHMLL